MTWVCRWSHHCSALSIFTSPSSPFISHLHSVALSISYLLVLPLAPTSIVHSRLLHLFLHGSFLSMCAPSAIIHSILIPILLPDLLDHFVEVLISQFCEKIKSLKKKIYNNFQKNKWHQTLINHKGWDAHKLLSIVHQFYFELIICLSV